ncbi:MAG: glycosyltransferase [Chloroflexota bacterium]
MERQPAQPLTPPESELIHTLGLLVSVVIVGYNSHEWLDDCTSSLLAQIHQPIEIILIDNGS